MTFFRCSIGQLNCGSSGRFAAREQSRETDHQSFEDEAYPRIVNEQKEEAASRIGLCSNCRFMRAIKSDRGAIFYLCRLSATNANFPKYPRLPVRQCPGYDPSTGENREASD
jgi:hypothetical protein